MLAHDGERERHGLGASAGVACAEGRVVGTWGERAVPDAPAEGDAVGPYGLARACQRAEGERARAVLGVRSLERGGRCNATVAAAQSRAERVIATCTFAAAESVKRNVVPSGAFLAETTVSLLATRKRLLVRLAAVTAGGCGVVAPPPLVPPPPPVVPPPPLVAASLPAQVGVSPPATLWCSLPGDPVAAITKRAPDRAKTIWCRPATMPGFHRSFRS